MQENRSVYPAMLELVALGVAQLAEREIDPVAFAGVVPGSNVSADYCGAGDECGGQLTVRLVTSFPSSNFPQADEAAKCNSAFAHRLEVAIVRCVPVLDREGTPPGVAEQEAAVATQLADMDAMLAAICELDKAKRYRQVLVETYTPAGPEGGCGGGSWTFLFQEGRD